MLMKLAMILLMGIVLLSLPLPVRADTPIIEVGAQETIQLLSNQLAESRKQTYSELSRLGFGAEVAALQKQGVGLINNFSASSVIESLYRRAETRKRGEGARFLAILYKDAASNSAAISRDPYFVKLKNRFSGDELDIRKQPIQFAPVSEIPKLLNGPPLPKQVEKAIGFLSEAYSGRGLAQMRVLALRTFRARDFNARAFERTLLESTTPEEALRKLVKIGTPQPKAEVALRTLMLDAMARSASLSIDPAAIEVMKELSRDLPLEQQRYAAAEDILPSRMTQMTEAQDAKQPGKIEKSERKDVIASLDGNGGDGLKEKSKLTSHPDAVNFRNSYEKYIDETFEKRNNDTSSKTNPSRFSNSTTPPRTSRLFSVASVSPAAGRGVSVGAKVTSDIKAKPASAIWLANDMDNRFGRLFVLFPPKSGSAPVVAASRVLFTDSFRAAQAVLSSSHNPTSVFQEGEILVLMSMDPSSAVTREASKKQQEKINAVRMAGIEKLTETEKRRLIQLSQALKGIGDNPHLDANAEADARKKLTELISLSSKGVDRLDKKYINNAMEEIAELSAERGVVTHPALFGRELAWSTIRIDFWYNQLNALAKEAQTMNGGRKIPQNLKRIAPRDMDTWQYYERGSRISLRSEGGKALKLVVTSLANDTNPAVSSAGERSHFSVAMFSQLPGTGSTPAEDGLFRRPDVEKEYQPLLDWLATNHHDFMRLNDFSESFSLLRWLGSIGTSVTVENIAQDRTALATPDRVDVRKGPYIGSEFGRE